MARFNLKGLEAARQKKRLQLDVPEFVRRMSQPNAPFIQNLDGTKSTHKMAWGSDDEGHYAFPTIVNRNGSLVELPANEADTYAHQTGELKRFNTQAEAEAYAAGSWKDTQSTTLRGVLPKEPRKLKLNLEALQQARAKRQAASKPKKFKLNLERLQSARVTRRAIGDIDPNRVSELLGMRTDLFGTIPRRPMELRPAPERKPLLERAFGYVSPPEPPEWDRASPIEKLTFTLEPATHLLTRIGGQMTKELGLTSKEDVNRVLGDQLKEDLKWFQKSPEAIGWTAETVMEYMALSGIFRLTGLHNVLTKTGQKLARPLLAKELAAKGGIQQLRTLTPAGLKALGKKTLTSFLQAAPENTAFIGSWSGLDALMKGKPVKEVIKETGRGAGWGLAWTGALSVIGNIAGTPEIKTAAQKAIAYLNQKYPRLVDMVGRDVEPEFIDAVTQAYNKAKGTNVSFVDLPKNIQAYIRNAARATKAEVSKVIQKEATVRAYWAAGQKAPTAKAPPKARIIPKAITPAAEGKITKMVAEILPRKQEILSQISEAIKQAPVTREFDITKHGKAHFEIDGGVTVSNDKDALQNLYNKVKALPEKEHIPKRIPKPTKKKPLAGKKEDIGRLHKAPEGYFTDGHLMIKGKPPATAKYADIPRPISEESLLEVLNKETQPAKFEHYAWKSPISGKGISGDPIAATRGDIEQGFEPMAVFKSEGKYYTYVQDKFNAIRNRYPNAEYGIVPDNGQLVGYVGGEPIAVLMPVGEEVGTEKPPVDMTKTLEQEEIESYQKGYSEALETARKSAKEPDVRYYPEPENEVAGYGKALGKTREQVTADLKATGLDDEVIKIAVNDAFAEPAKAAEEITTIQTNVGTIEIPANELEGDWQKALETIFDYGNQTQANKPIQPGLARSLSMGDTVEYEGKTWLVMPKGWQDVSQLSKGEIDKLVGEAKLPEPPAEKPKAALDWQGQKKAELKSLEGKRFKTAHDEIKIERIEKQLKENISKWQVGQGVGWKVTKGQVNRGLQIVEVYSETHQAKIRFVKDTGQLADYKQGQTNIVDTVDLIRDKKFDQKPEALAKPAPAAEKPAKEVWEMTSQEYKDFNLQALKEVGIKGKPQITDHKEKIKYAVEQGKIVPRHVLEEYKSEKWAQEALAKPAKIRSTDDYYNELIAKWGDDKYIEAIESLSGADERFTEIEDRFMALDDAGKGETPEANKLQNQMFDIIDTYLAKRGKGEPFEAPSMFDIDALNVERISRKPAPKTVEAVVIDSFREWPKHIKHVGRDFWTEIMTTAKKLLTPYRYRALRQTMLGAFRYKKGLQPSVVGIELQDVRDVLSATHEIGHNIDFLLNDKRYPPSIKARLPYTEIAEAKLRVELKKVSKLLRPKLWKAAEKKKGRLAYVNRHDELMADFISHYILDPDKTRELAPNVTELFEKKIAENPVVFDSISALQESRYEGAEEVELREGIKKRFPLEKELKPLQLNIDMTSESYVKAAESLGIDAVRHHKVLIRRADIQAARIDKLVPDKKRQTDLVVIAENGSKNPWTDKTKEEILKEGLTVDERKALNLYRGYQELARQTVNKYLRNSDIAEYIKFIEDYYIHAYHTPLTQKYRSAISRWAKRSPQAKKRVLPDINSAVELGLTPRTKTLSEGLKLWAGINTRVATNIAFLKTLPKITNDDGVSVLQSPSEFPNWPTVDYWPIRKTYALPLRGRGILLVQGRIAVDPRVKPFIDAMFGRKVFKTPIRYVEKLNALWKGCQLTLFSLFHHQAEFFSACGSLGPRALPFVGGYYGKKAEQLGAKKPLGFLPARIGVLKAGKALESVPEFMDDYLAHGGQVGYITTEGRNLLERMFKDLEGYLKNIIQTRPIIGKAVWIPYVPARTARDVYTFHQKLLWDNVQRAKLVTYYHVVADGAKNSDLPIKKVKETAAKYIADNYGGQEWLNTMFRKPKTRQFWTQAMMSLDWTWSQIKTARWPFAFGGKTVQEQARRQLMRKIGRHHWFWYLSAIAGFTIAGNYAMNGKGPWENERGHKLDIDWTPLWRKLPWNQDWEQRGDYSRRYIGLGKAGRELVRWVTSPLLAFGYKLSPVARSSFEQMTGFNIGSSWAEPWAREDLELYEEIYARSKHLMENFVPFAFSGNNAFLAFPSRKGMTRWKAVRAYEDIYKAQAKIAMGGISAKLTKADRLLVGNGKKLLADIQEACEQNRVDFKKTQRAALSNVRSQYYRLFWRAAKLQNVEHCNRYAKALLRLRVVPQGFKQSLRFRIDELPKEARDTGIKVFRETAIKER